METVQETVDIRTASGTMAAVITRPDDSVSRPAVIMVHGSPGLNEDIPRMAADLAAEGFAVLAPDMFYRTGRLRTATMDQPQEVRDAMQEGLTEGAIISDVQEAIGYLRQQPYVSQGGIGITGFCLGGRVSYLASVHNNGIGAAVMWYPTRLCAPDPRTPRSTAPIASAAAVQAPIIGFFPTLDLKHCPPEIIAEVKDAFEREGVDGEVVPVEGAKHGFVEPTSPAYHPTEGPKAWAHMVAFFNQHLR